MDRLERALVANWIVHGLAIVGMAAILLPFLPGGGHTDAERIALIAEHPWRFRLGWLPWQACAVCDVWMAIAMVRTPWLSRKGTIAVLVLTAVAVVPDQYAQAMWITRGVELAQAGDYLAFERDIFPLTAAWAALGYTLAALAWTYSFARAGAWSRTLTVLSVTVWSTMFVAVLGPLVGAPPAMTGIANGLGFLQMQLWLGLVCEHVLRRRRPFEAHGRMARWHHPGKLAPLWDAIANSRLLGALLEPLPEFAMRSDITNVVYVSYLIPASEAQRYLPAGLELQRLGPSQDHALFTFLTFQHGHFGLRIMGPLRKLMPSPVHSNWRIHVVDPRTGHRGIYFVTNAIASTLQALAARLTTEGMPMHVLARGTVERTGDALRVSLDPGGGSAPDAELALSFAPPPMLTGVWADCFTDWTGFLSYCVPQDRAMSSQPLKRRISRQEIDLGIPLSACTPLTGSVSSRAARAIAGDREPLCFHVAHVTFEFSIEAHDRMSAGSLVGGHAGDAR